VPFPASPQSFPGIKEYKYVYSLWFISRLLLATSLKIIRPIKGQWDRREMDRLCRPVSRDAPAIFIGY
jgi:hypothetical protein